MGRHGPVDAVTGAAAKARSRPDVSLVIASYNTKDETTACLESVFEQTQGLSFEVIVVDNASADGSAQAVEERFPQVKLLKNSANRGFAHGCNQGMAVASGRYLLLLNPDTEILDNAIFKALRFAEMNPDAGAVGCRIFSPEGRQVSNIFRCNRLADLWWNIFIPHQAIAGTRWDRSPLLNAHRYGGADLTVVQEVETISGCFMLVRREALEDAGPMDDRFFLYGEETEWCHRMRKKGWKILYFPGADVKHHQGKSSDKDRKRAALVEARSYILLYYLVHGPVCAYFANLLCFLRDTPRVAVWAALSRMPGLKRARMVELLETSRRRYPYHLKALFSRSAMLRRYEIEAEARS